MSRVRIMNSDREVTAVKFNLKEQRCLQKNLVTLDAEASYSVKLIDMENRGMKVFYRRFRDKVGKIRSHLKVNEISRLRDLESSGRLSPPANTVNTTATLRIADAEKRLKLQGREHLRKTKSAFVSRSVSTDKASQMNTFLKASYDSHLNTSRENISTQKRPSTIAWDSKLNGSREGLDRPSRRQSKVEKMQPVKTKPCDSPQGINSITAEELQHVCYAPTSVCVVHGEENPIPSNPVLNSENQKRNSMILSPNFIQTGNLDSPRILNKTSDMIQNKPETLNETEIEDIKDRNSNDKNQDLDENLIVHDQEQIVEKEESVDKLFEQPEKVENLDENSQHSNLTSQEHESDNRKDEPENRKDEPENREDEPESRKDIGEVKKCSATEHKTSQHDHKHKQREIIHNDKTKDGTADSCVKSGSESPRNSKYYNKLAVPRAKQSKSAHCQSIKSARSGAKSNFISPRRSISATGKSTNTVSMNKQYSCHNYDREAAKMMESRASISISDGLFCFGDDPYEERRQLMIMDEHSRFVILLHKKEEYLQRIEEYIRLQMIESSKSYAGEKESGKKGKSPKDIWDELKKCRYLRKEDDDEEDIDLSTVVTLASEQMKNKQALKYKPLFQKKKSKKTIIVDPEENAQPTAPPS